MERSWNQRWKHIGSHGVRIILSWTGLEKVESRVPVLLAPGEPVCLATTTIIRLFGVPFVVRVALAEAVFLEIMRLSRDSACHCSRSVCQRSDVNGENNSASRVPNVRSPRESEISTRRKINYPWREI